MIRDVLAAAHVGFFAQVALVLFLLAFAAILIRLWRQPRAEVDELARLPLADDQEPPKPTHVPGGSVP
jgi:cbb3-type cytochrome oxidase subunit 3